MQRAIVLAMPLPESLRRRLTPRVTGWCGLASVPLLLTGICLAWALFPGYSPLSGYISELGKHHNPGRHWFAAGLLAAGPCITVFTLGLHRLMTNRPGRIAARLLTATGLSMPVVALFDLEFAVIHFSAAAVLIGAAVIGTVFAGVAFRRMAAAAQDPGERRTLRLASHLSFATFGLQIGSTIGGFVYTGVLVARMTVTSAEQLLKELPKHQRIDLGGGWVLNPVALMEWVFLATAVALILLLSVYALGRRDQPATDS